MTMLSRREAILLATSSVLSAAPVAARSRDTGAEASGFDRMLQNVSAQIPDYRSFPTIDAARRSYLQLRAAHPGLVSVRQLGFSGYGRPIELISVGRGPLSALVVAGVHANEQVGSLTVQFLMEQILANAQLRAELDYTWHFINPIDPDGTYFNEGWFTGPITVSDYLHHFFRPGARRQPDYTFPLHVGSVSFNSSPPENVAFRHAIDITKPDFLYTLHNSDYGGAAFVTSRSLPELERRLLGIPGRFGLRLDTSPDPLSPDPLREPGISSMPSTAEMLRAVLAAHPHTDLRPYAPAGDSSTSYAKRYGSFCFITEVPYWDDARIYNSAPSGQTLGHLLGEVLNWLDAGADILHAGMSRLTPDNCRDPEFYWAAKEALAGRAAQSASLRASIESGAADHITLTVSQATSYEVQMNLATLRPFALLLHLVSGREQESVAAFIDARLKALESKAPLRSIPLRSLVGIQAIAALEALRAVAAQLSH